MGSGIGDHRSWSEAGIADGVPPVRFGAPLQVEPGARAALARLKRAGLDDDPDDADYENAGDVSGG